MFYDTDGINIDRLEDEAHSKFSNPKQRENWLSDQITAFLINNCPEDEVVDFYFEIDGLITEADYKRLTKHFTNANWDISFDDILNKK